MRANIAVLAVCAAIAGCGADAPRYQIVAENGGAQAIWRIDTRTGQLARCEASGGCRDVIDLPLQMNAPVAASAAASMPIDYGSLADQVIKRGETPSAAHP